MLGDSDIGVREDTTCWSLPWQTDAQQQMVRGYSATVANPPEMTLG